jgi:hypothetical protein
MAFSSGEDFGVGATSTMGWSSTGHDRGPRGKFGS